MISLVAYLYTLSILVEETQFFRKSAIIIALFRVGEMSEEGNRSNDEQSKHVDLTFPDSSLFLGWVKQGEV